MILITKFCYSSALPARPLLTFVPYPVNKSLHFDLTPFIFRCQPSRRRSPLHHDREARCTCLASPCHVSPAVPPPQLTPSPNPSLAYNQLITAYSELSQALVKTSAAISDFTHLLAATTNPNEVAALMEGVPAQLPFFAAITGKSSEAVSHF